MKSVFGLCLSLAFFTFGGAGGAQADGRPGQFDYYTMALSWSPTYCATQGRRRPNEPQCSGDRSYAFVLHGLWPQYNRGWPDYCETGKRPWVSKKLIREMLDIMPSKRLVIHQYRKHGVCSGLDPKGYFALSRKLYESVKIPKRFQTPQDYQTVSPAEVEKAFLEANPSMKPDMISIDCKGRNLRELRICFSKNGKLASCGQNERQSKLCSSNKITMPPVRAGGGGNGRDQQEEDYEENGEDDDRY